jgi:hypothetical protein
MKRNGFKILFDESEGKRRVARHRYRWKSDIKTSVKEVGCKDAYRCHLSQDAVQWQAVVNTVMNLWVTQNTTNILTS